jgi:IMP dehydrogenase/GMP reductase
MYDTGILQFVNHVRRTREAHPRKTLIAGNVVTGEMVEELILSGADIVKVSQWSSNFVSFICDL